MEKTNSSGLVGWYEWAKDTCKVVTNRMSWFMADTYISNGRSGAGLMARFAYEGSVGAITYMINQGEDVDGRKEGVAPVLEAIRANQIAVVKLLVNNGAVINFCQNGWSPIILAATLDPDCYLGRGRKPAK